MTLDYFRSTVAGHCVEHQSHGLIRGSAVRACHSCYADAEGGLAAVTNALGEGGRDFAADCAVALDHDRRHSGEFCLEFVGIYDRASQEIARAAAYRGNAFG